MYTRFLVFFFLLAGVSSYSQTRKLAPEDFKKLHDSIGGQLVDVRTPEEFKSGYIKDAVNINAYDSDFLQRLEALDKNQPVLVYCKVGGRSAKAAEELVKMGFEVYELTGGILSWENRGLPLFQPDGQAAPDKFTRVDFDRLLQDNPKLLIDFYAPWCGPCKQMEPALNALSKKYSGQLLVYRLNIDEAKALARDLNVEAIPILTIYHKGKPVETVKGYQTDKQLHKLVKTLAQLR